MHRSVVRYQSQAKDQAPLTARIKEIAAVRVRYGYKRIHVLLRREGWGVNHKRVYLLPGRPESAPQTAQAARQCGKPPSAPGSDQSQ